MRFNPDLIVIWEFQLSDWGTFKINATIFYTWLVMAILSVGSVLVTRRLSTGLYM